MKVVVKSVVLNKVAGATKQLTTLEKKINISAQSSLVLYELLNSFTAAGFYKLLNWRNMTREHNCLVELLTAHAVANRLAINGQNVQEPVH